MTTPDRERPLSLKDQLLLIKNPNLQGYIDTAVNSLIQTLEQRNNQLPITNLYEDHDFSQALELPPHQTRSTLMEIRRRQIIFPRFIKHPTAPRYIATWNRPQTATAVGLFYTIRDHLQQGRDIHLVEPREWVEATRKQLGDSPLTGELHDPVSYNEGDLIERQLRARDMAQLKAAQGIESPEPRQRKKY